MLSVIMLIVGFYICYAECCYAECHYAECHYAECCYAECRGAIKRKKTIVFSRICKLNAKLASEIGQVNRLTSPKIGPFLFLSQCPGWPRQVECRGRFVEHLGRT
jgi:hypothetical protein